jgi:hypothetical protein
MAAERDLVILKAVFGLKDLSALPNLNTRDPSVHSG